MQTVTVEWRHLDKDGVTCDRCAETGSGIMELVQQMDVECRPSGVRIQFTETRLSAAASILTGGRSSTGMGEW